MAHICENCKFRAHYDKKPDSMLGKFWRWHINFCPGWRSYFTRQSDEKKVELREKYDFKKYQVMAYTGRFGQSEEYRREELIRKIEHSVENLTLQELEALYYDMSTKNYINE